jgi:hypothetical protein
MGAWGEGMRDNDTAEDIIQTVRDWGMDAVATAADVAGLFDRIAADAGRPGGWTGDRWAILGLADHLVEAGADLGWVVGRIERAVVAEEADATLARWADPASRRAELAAFRRRLRASVARQAPSA